MLSIRFFLILSVGYFFLFPVFGNTTCDCEKIIKEKKCDNPDCIKICNLQSVFDSAGQLLQEKCLKKITTEKKEKFKEKELFSAKGVKGTAAIALDVEGFLKKKKKIIKTINQKNKNIVKKTCPGCYLHSKVTTKITPQRGEENCDKYIQTEEF